MMRPLLLPLALAAGLTLTGCKSASEKAEEYYLSGMDYIEKGDEERGLLELRNVFRYDGFHKEARRAYAEVLISRGDLTEGYGQYLRLIEQYPDTPDVRRILAELALERGDWDEARRHGEAALALTPDDPALAPVRISLAYHAAAMLRDAPALASLTQEAETLLAGPLRGNMLLGRVAIDSRLASDSPQTALPLIVDALEANPKLYDLQKLRYTLVVQAGDQAEIGAQLKRMAELFPEDQAVRNGLVGWYLRQGDEAGAEAYLRSLTGDPKGETGPHMQLVAMLERLKGRPAAIEEIKALRTANAGTPKADFYGAELARIAYAEGRRDEAIADLRAILASATPSEQSRAIEVDLARYLASAARQAPAMSGAVSGAMSGAPPDAAAGTGSPPNSAPNPAPSAGSNAPPSPAPTATGGLSEARALVERVLAADRSNVEALKLRATWAIEADRPTDAILDLRAALDQAPRDSEVLSLMAVAHERDGSLDLAGERLALALEASEGGIPETLRYANFLIRNDRLQLASRVLGDGRSRHPQSLDILGLLSDVFVREQLWDRALEVVKAMEALPLTPEGAARVRGQRAVILAGQNRIEESLALLEDSAEGAGLTGSAQLLQAQIAAGRLVEARALLEELRAAQPELSALKMFDASLSGVEGRPERAEEIWRAMLAADPAAEPPAQMLYGYLVSTGRRAEAGAILDGVLAASPAPSAVLRWLKAGDLEAQGRLDEAITLYEAMYAEDSTNAVVANNLASLLANHRADPDSLERAERIARRLRGQTVPAFQDTYGWIALRRGNLEEAQNHLVPAAAGLPEDAQVQLHLGLLYERQARRDEAKIQLERAAALASASEASPATQAVLQEANAALARLKGTEPGVAGSAGSQSAQPAGGATGTPGGGAPRP